MPSRDAWEGATVIRTIRRVQRCVPMLAVAFAMTAIAASAQEFGLEDEAEPVESEATRRLRELTDPEARAEKAEKNQKPPFEFYRTQVAPFDVLTFVKPNHWVTLTQELKANLGDYEGGLRTSPIGLLNMPRSVVFRRDARLIEGESMRLSWPAFFPTPAKSLDVALVRPGALRPDDSTQAPLLPMLPHQMLVVILAKDPIAYDIWKRSQALIPATTDLGDQQLVERRSYYRLVIPQEPGKPNLPAHPLTWTTISHVVWDEFEPNLLDAGQQRALIDWLHWGGQLIITGGPTASPALLSDAESFLAPYLPAEPSGESSTLTEADLRSISARYPPPVWKFDRMAAASADYSLPVTAAAPYPSGGGSRYGPIDPIDLPPDRPLYLSGLAPIAADVSWIADDEGRRFGIERRVGRGRILMLAFDPKEAALLRWKGYDTFVRRVLFRRGEDRWNPLDPNDISMQSGPELSWYRLVARDLEPAPEESPRSRPALAPDPFGRGGTGDPADATIPEDPVAAWLDNAKLPALAREGLVAASGIEVPGSPFVLRVILAYLAALVPLNWLVCRFVLRRRELAWAVVPVLAFGFAVVVERAAAIDTGYDRACDEVDVLELQPGYPRAHLSRFAVLYSTGRENFSISFPGDPSALALPFNANLAIRGEQTTESTWQATPGPALLDFRVEPRSLAMLRAEQMLDLRGGLGIGPSDDGARSVVNQTELNLRDAILVDVGVEPEGGGNRFTPIGDIPAGGTAAIPVGRPSFSEVPLPDGGAGDDRPDWIDLSPFLESLSAYDWGRPEDAGELRLVAWAEGVVPGAQLDPGVDRHRGLTLVVAHLGYAPPPSPDGPTYTSFEPDRRGLPDRARPSPEPDRP